MSSKYYEELGTNVGTSYKEGLHTGHTQNLLKKMQIAAVCDFFCYVRYIQQGLVKSGIHEIYWEVIKRRRDVSLARLGILSLRREDSSVTKLQAPNISQNNQNGVKYLPDSFFRRMLLNLSSFLQNKRCKIKTSNSF